MGVTAIVTPTTTDPVHNRAPPSEHSAGTRYMRRYEPPHSYQLFTVPQGPGSPRDLMAITLKASTVSSVAAVHIHDMTLSGPYRGTGEINFYLLTVNVVILYIESRILQGYPKPSGRWNYSI
jgi:hypothetical protein